MAGNSMSIAHKTPLLYNIPTMHFFLYAILPALLFQTIGSLLYFIIFPNGAVAQSIYTATKILLVVWPLVWITQLKTQFNLKPNRLSLAYGILPGIVGAGTILSVFFFYQDYFTQFSPTLIEKIAALNLTSPIIFILFALFLSLIHSLLEEYYWRWFVFTGLKQRFSPIVAGIIGSIAFAGHHYIILSQFFPLPITLLFGTLVGVGGAWWCYSYHKTGTLFGNWMSHALIDAAIMVVGFVLVF